MDEKWKFHFFVLSYALDPNNQEMFWLTWIFQFQFLVHSRTIYPGLEKVLSSISISDTRASLGLQEHSVRTRLGNWFTLGPSTK